MMKTEESTITLNDLVDQVIEVAVHFPRRPDHSYGGHLNTSGRVRWVKKCSLTSEDTCWIGSLALPADTVVKPCCSGRQDLYDIYLKAE